MMGRWSYFNAGSITETRESFIRTPYSVTPIGSIDEITLRPPCDTLWQVTLLSRSPIACGGSKPTHYVQKASARRQAGCLWTTLIWAAILDERQLIRPKKSDAMAVGPSY